MYRGAIFTGSEVRYQPSENVVVRGNHEGEATPGTQIPTNTVRQGLETTETPTTEEGSASIRLQVITGLPFHIEA